MSRQAVLICGSILFFLACVFPALEFRRNENGIETWPGFQILIIGWMGMLIGQFAWFANPFLLGAALSLFLKRRRACVICAGLALLISLHTFALFGTTVPADEGGVGKLFLQRVREGTWLWLASIVVMLVGGCLARLDPRPPAQIKPANGLPEIVDDAWV